MNNSNLIFKILIVYLLFSFKTICQDISMKYNKLTKEEERVIVHKGTEAPFTGKYNDHYQKGDYICKRCDAVLYRSSSKFKSGCGWPSFDDEVEGAVDRIKDADGVRTEIVCSKCKSHLGHVFLGEGFTPKNVRHCVNSISLKFVPYEENKKIEKAIFAGGCFWGVEYYFEKLKGVISAKSGYIGGSIDNPTYQQVCMGNTKHVEAVEVEYNPDVINYEYLCRYFFEIHDPTQLNRQGPDIGYQYSSVVFYNDEEQKKIAQNLLNILKTKGLHVKTKLIKATKFWKAEGYHQNYYKKKGGSPYCHTYVKKF